MENELNVYGEALRKARMQARRKLKEVAETLSVRVSHLSDIEHGRRRPLDADTTERLEHYLEVESGSLMEARVRQLGAAEILGDFNEPLHREVAAMLMRRWSQLTPDELEQIKTVVGGGDEEDG